MSKEKLDYRDVSPKNIWNYRQNHPELVIKDMTSWAKQWAMSPVMRFRLIHDLRLSLMARGVNKWLKVRRDLIAYKKQIKKIIRDVLEVEKAAAKERMGHEYIAMHEVIRLIGDIAYHEGGDGQNDAVDAAVAAVEKYVRYRDERERYVTLRERCKDYQSVRHVLKMLCMTDRWQEWEGKKIEEMNTIKASGN